MSLLWFLYPKQGILRLPRCLLHPKGNVGDLMKIYILMITMMIYLHEILLIDGLLSKT